MLRRLYLQIYLTIIGSLVLVVALSAITWNVFGRDRLDREALDIVGKLTHLALPAAGLAEAEQTRVLRQLAAELDVDLTLYDADRRLVGATGRVHPPPPEGGEAGHWRRGRRPHHWMFGLPDGRWLIVDFGRRGGHHPLANLVLFLGVVAFAVGIGAYPLVRRMTRRLERLQKGVERIGAGDLSARVEVRGRDEIAELAASFNEAAGKIERLVESHRMLLAHASHELRTPLSRIRLGVEMLKVEGDPARREALEQDIAELDALIDEILLMSRLDAGADAGPGEPVDLLALAAEECAHYPEVTLSGAAPPVTGDPRLLRRLVRNLLENAHAHGAPPAEVRLSAEDGQAVLRVADRGAGIPEELRDKVFESFYRGPGRQNVRGYGLGLPLVRRIAERHGGTVALGTGPAGGLEVRVTLAADG